MNSADLDVVSMFEGRARNIIYDIRAYGIQGSDYDTSESDLVELIVDIVKYRENYKEQS